MNTKFACSGRNWPLFFIWRIFLDLRLSIHLPTLVHLHRDKFIRCFLLRFPRRWPVGRLGFVCFCVGGRWVDVWGPWVDESSESRWFHGSMVGAPWVDEPNSCGVWVEVPFQTDVGPPNEEDQPTQRVSTRQQCATT